MINLFSFSALFLPFSSVAQSCPTLCDPMECSTPGLPVHHQLPAFAQSHVHQVGDAIQPSHPLSSPSPPAFNLSQHQGLFQRVSQPYSLNTAISLVQSSGKILPVQRGNFTQCKGLCVLFHLALSPTFTIPPCLLSLAAQTSCVHPHLPLPRSHDTR